MSKDKSKICRSFRQDFPEFVARAEALDVKISLGEGQGWVAPRRNGRRSVGAVCDALESDFTARAGLVEQIGGAA